MTEDPDSFEETVQAAQFYISTLRHYHDQVERFQRYEKIMRLLRHIGDEASELEFSDTLMCPTFYLTNLPPPRQYTEEENVDFCRKWVSCMKAYNFDVVAVGPTEDPRTWLCGAIWSGHLLIAQALIESGADVDFCEYGDSSLLHGALQGFDLLQHSREVLHSILVLLLAAGCDPHARGDSGNSPFDYAQSLGVVEVWLDALQIAGIDMDRYFVILNGEYGESTAIEQCIAPKQELALRRRYDFDGG